MKRNERRQLCDGRALNRIRHYKLVMAERLKETKKLFGRKICAVDIHTHSNFSDGAGTIADNHSHARTAGLDFLFATDHQRIGQRAITRRWRDASWGQEPGIRAGTHHIGLLCNKRVFRTRPGSLLENLKAARELAPFVWIPHPVGWYSQTWYSDQAVSELWDAGDAFAIEVINGALKVLHAYDQFDAKAVATWDRLLSEGRKVTALGGSDAHCPADIGTVWTGAFAESVSAPAIIKALNKGLCFASEAALLDFSVNDKPMGSTLKALKGKRLRIKFRVADSAGVALVRIVSQGKIIREINGRREKLVEGAFEQKPGRLASYYRLESMSSDDLRAFSTPIYVEPR